MSAYHYTECGLDNVFIEGISPITDDDGDQVIEINFVNALHHEIAKGIVNHRKAMSGAELRFLRTEMGLTQTELAELVHVTRLTVGRWERGDNRIDPASEMIIRQMAIEKLVIPFEDGIEKLSQRVAEAAEAPQPINIQAVSEGYRLEAA